VVESSETAELVTEAQKEEPKPVEQVENTQKEAIGSVAAGGEVSQSEMGQKKGFCGLPMKCVIS